jgi:hypothetical protein
MYLAHATMTVLMPATDGQLLGIVTTPVDSVPEVIALLEAIDETLAEADGLKWFNWLYLNVTRAVNASLTVEHWQNPLWISTLDVVFARLYLNALELFLTPGAAPPKCWQVLFRSRTDARLARIQFALAGINAHINHDLAKAVVETCQQLGFEPMHLSAQYQDYCLVNKVLDPIVDRAKVELQIGLLGDNLPAMHLVENLAAMWSLRAVRETAWTNAEIEWQLRAMPALADRFTIALDDSTALAGRGLLAPVGI